MCMLFGAAWTVSVILSVSKHAGGTEKKNDMWKLQMPKKMKAVISNSVALRRHILTVDISAGISLAIMITLLCCLFHGDIVFSAITKHKDVVSQVNENEFLSWTYTAGVSHWKIHGQAKICRYLTLAHYILLRKEILVAGDQNRTKREYWTLNLSGDWNMI